MPQSAKNVAFLALLAGLVAALAFGLSRRSRGPTDALSMAPVRSVAIAELDVPGLRGSALFRELVGESDSGLEDIERTCGFNPLDQLRTVHVFLLHAPEGEGDEAEESLDEVAFLARGSLDHQALAQCIGDVVAGDGGGVHATTIEGAEALASDHGSSVAAFYGRDGVVAGVDTVVAELLRIQDGASAPMPHDASLTRLFRRASGRAHVRLVARLPRNWQRFLGRLGELAAELPALGQARALGLGATLGDGIAITLALDLGARDDAEDTRRGIEAQIQAALRDPELATSALAIALRHVSLEAEGPDLVARAELDRPELDATIALLRRALADERALP